MRHLDQALTDHPITPSASCLRLLAVTQVTGLARSTIYRLVSQGQFPAPVRLASRAAAWRRGDLEQWLETRPVASRGAPGSLT